jgi:large subunit ribosomal protein L19
MIAANYKDTALHVGQMIRVRSNIVEGSKTRIQAYEGMLIALRGRGVNLAMVVRRIGPGGVGVERIWPLNSPQIVDVTIVREPKNVRRSKLYYLREVKGRAASRV